MRIIQKLQAHGHSEIRATHLTTLELTREERLTARGDCIIGVGASIGAAGLDDEFKALARNVQTRLSLIIKVDGITDIVRGHGDFRLSFLHPTDLVVRRSCYIDSRTLMVDADKAAKDINREIIKKLGKTDKKVLTEIVAEL